MDARLPAQKDQQQNSGSYSEKKSETLTYKGGERIGKKFDKFHIHTVSHRHQKVGKLGRKINLRANHFQMSINVPDGVMYH